MKLLHIDTPQLVELVAKWLAEESNYQWLDFGGGRQIVTPALLKVMLQRPAHFMRAFTSDAGEPIGVVALNDVNRRLRTGTLWGVAGEKSFRSRGYATLAGSALLTLAFRDLGLHAINTWLVEHNPSRRIIERLNFRYVGRLRECHCIGGKFYDRLFYDLLESEHRELSYDDVRGFAERQQRNPNRSQSISSGCVVDDAFSS